MDNRSLPRTLRTWTPIIALLLSTYFVHAQSRTPATSKLKELTPNIITTPLVNLFKLPLAAKQDSTLDRAQLEKDLHLVRRRAAR